MEYMTMAQACGEQPMSPLSYVAGIDFDPYDSDECAAVFEATERDKYDRMHALETENARLRGLLNETYDN